MSGYISIREKGIENMANFSEVIYYLAILISISFRLYIRIFDMIMFSQDLHSFGRRCSFFKRTHEAPGFISKC